MGYQPFDVLKQHMEKAKAFVFAAEEDFGIIPVEAQACGTPVIAFGKGGALETVIPMGCNEPTGVFFSQQTSKSIIDAIQVFENNIGLFTPESCRKNAERFSQERFEREFNIYVDSKWTEFCNSRQIIR